MRFKSSLHHVLGGSWAVISGVISPRIWVIIMVTLLITPLITTLKPSSLNPIDPLKKPKTLIPKPYRSLKEA